MPGKLLPIIKRNTVADETTEIHLARSGYDFVFKAGQYAELCLSELLFDDPKGSCREFSIVSSPNNTLALTFIFRDSESGFKRSLKAAPLGTLVEVSGPYGLFALPESKQPIIMIAGGIGVTPFLSMIRYAMEENKDYDITLIHSNKTQERTVYGKELEEWKKSFTRLQVIQNIGHITPDLIQANLKEKKDSVFFVAGPPRMIQDAIEVLKNLDINQDRIFEEEFTGYA